MLSLTTELPVREHYIPRRNKESLGEDFYLKFRNFHHLIIALGAKTKKSLPSFQELTQKIMNSVKTKNVLSRVFFLMYTKKKNNYYFTVINYFGQVILSKSCGQIVETVLKKRNKKIRTSTNYFNLMIKQMSKILRRRKIRKISNFLKTDNINFYNTKRIIKLFLKYRIKIRSIRYTPGFRHALPIKTKKARRL